MKTLKQLRGILETPVEQDDNILIGKMPKLPLEEDVEKQLIRKKRVDERGRIVVNIASNQKTLL